MKRCVLISMILTAALLTFGGCGTKTLHCDGCNKELKVSKSSNMEEDWIIFCEDCEEEVFGDEPLVEESNQFTNPFSLSLPILCQLLDNTLALYV